jgi:hypothetical protein
VHVHCARWYTLYAPASDRCRIPVIIYRNHEEDLCFSSASGVDFRRSATAQKTGISVMGQVRNERTYAWQSDETGESEYFDLIWRYFIQLFF